MRLCTLCDTKKLESEFNRKSKTKNTGQCKKCISKYQKKFRGENKESIKRYRVEYKGKNYEKLLEKKRAYYQNNKEKLKKSGKEYYKKNKETISIKQTEYYYKNKGKVKDRAKKFKENNRDYVKEVNAKYGYKYKRENRVKVNNHTKVSRAIKKGILTRGSCLLCIFRKGKINNHKIEGHHPDDTKSLDVIWLCKEHHQETHKITKQYNSIKG